MKQLPRWLLRRAILLLCLCLAGTITYPAMANITNISLPFVILTVYSFITGLAGLTTPFVKLSPKLTVILTLSLNFVTAILYVSLALFTDFMLVIYLILMFFVFIRESVDNRMFILINEYTRVKYGEHQVKFQEISIFGVSFAEVLVGSLNIILAFFIAPNYILVIGAFLLIFFDLFSIPLMCEMYKDIEKENL